MNVHDFTEKEITAVITLLIKEISRLEKCSPESADINELEVIIEKLEKM